MRWSNSVAALAILLCLIVVGAMVLHEHCRLGDARLSICDWMGVPHVGGPLPAP